MNEPSISASFFKHTSLEPSHYATALYETIARSTFPPTHFGPFEPIRTEFSKRLEFHSVWHQQSHGYFGQVLLRRSKKPKFHADVTFSFGPDKKSTGRPPYHSVSVYGLAESDFDETTEAGFLDLADKIFENLDMDYGFVCSSEEYARKNIEKDFRHADGSVEPRRVVGMRWPYCLPGLYWINYFGERYIEDGLGKGTMEGAESESALGMEIVQVGSGIRLQVDSSLRFFESREAGDIEESIKAWLGEDWFFRTDRIEDCRRLNVSLHELRKPLPYSV